MAEGLTSTCSVMDKLGQQCKVSVKFPVSIIGNWFDKSNMLQTLLEDYMEPSAKVVGRSDNMSHVVTQADRSTWPDPTSRSGTVDQKAVIILRLASADKTPRRIEIPAPVDSMFYKVDESGWRVVLAAGVDIANQITAMGLPVTFIRGWLKSKK